jgi:hypothetical protein
MDNQPEILLYFAASVAKTKSDANANEDILSALGKRGPDALEVLIESLEGEEDVHRNVIDRIRKGECFVVVVVLV